MLANLWGKRDAAYLRSAGFASEFWGWYGGVLIETITVADD